MARHKRSAHEEKKKSAEFCSLCSLAFKGERSVELLSSHMAVDHKEDTFCGPCKKQFEDREKLAKHVRLWHTQYSCVYCGASCVGRLGLGKHISAVHMAGDYSCLICGRRFGDSKDMEEHLREEHICIGYSCYGCNEISLGWTEFNVHMQEYHGGSAAELRSSCQFCEQPFESEEKLRDHIWELYGLGGFFCRACTLPFNNEVLLGQHATEAHVAKIYCCLGCEKEGTGENDMWDHMMRTHGAADTVVFEEGGPRKDVAAPSSAPGGAKCSLCHFQSVASLKKHREASMRRHMLTVHSRSGGGAGHLSNSASLKPTTIVSLDDTSDQSIIDQTILPMVPGTGSLTIIENRKRKTEPGGDENGALKRAVFSIGRGPEGAVDVTKK